MSPPGGKKTAFFPEKKAESPGGFGFFIIFAKKKMIYLSKEMQSKVKTKACTKEELSRYLLTNLTVFEIADELAEYMLKETPVAQPITVTQEDMDRIVSLFKVRGIRCVEGNYVAETRGRKRVSTNKED